MLELICAIFIGKLGMVASLIELSWRKIIQKNSDNYFIAEVSRGIIRISDSLNI